MRQSCPDSLGVTKYLRTSLGAARGWFFSNLLLNPYRRLPSEKATLANLAVDTGISSLRRMRKYSIILFDAPIMLTGLAALSVETQKYFLAPAALACAMVLSVLNMLTSTMRMRV